MTAFCDLHTHSTFSDGTDTPTALIALAEERGLGALALTDHNTVAGLPEFLNAAQGKSVRAIAGTEFSTDFGGIELHILGLFLKPEVFPQITTLLEDYRLRKEKSNVDLVEKLNEFFKKTYADGTMMQIAKNYVDACLVIDSLCM